MRKHTALVPVIAVILSIILAVPAFAENGTVTGSDVNLRTGPGVEYTVIDCLPKGAELTVNDRSNSKWYNVTYNGTTGYISASYVSVIEENIAVVTEEDSGYTDSTAADQPAGQDVVQSSVQEASASSGNTGTVNAMYVRFRSGPGSSYSILGEYSKGARVTVSGTVNGWSAITVNGESGYMFSQYITMDEGTVQVETQVESEPVEETPAVVETPAPVEEETQPVQTASSEINGFVCGDSVCFRTGPSTAYKILGTYDRGKAVTVTGSEGDWKAIVIDGTAGYMFGRYISDTDPTGAYQAQSQADQTASQTEAQAQQAVTDTPAQTDGREGYITGNSVRFRTGASTGSDIICEYNKGQTVTITGSCNGWTACTINGRNGYVYSSYVSEGSYNTPAVVVSDTASTGSDFGRQVADYALGYLGYGYTWGGADPSTGFDCSGFTYYVFKHFGITLNRVACDQARNGEHVEHDDIQPGDLLCFYSGSDYIGHVGIYLGDNRFIHSSTSTTGVIISELSGLYVTRNYEARRLG